jgi:AsmA protein
VKRWTKILLALVVLVIAAVASIPLFVNANTFRPTIEKQLTTALGRSVKLGDLSLSPFSGSLVAKDLSVAGDPSFGAAPFLTANELRIGVSLRLLIFSHQVDVRYLQIESPQITLIRAANGTWNFSSIGRRSGASTTANDAPSGAASGNSSGSAPDIPDLSAGRIAIEEGRVTIASVPEHGEPSVYDHVNFVARDFSFASQFPFDLSANLPAGGTIRATGHAGPINRVDAATSHADAEISVKYLDFVAAGFIDPDAGVSLLADIETRAGSDGEALTTSGTAHIENLKLRKGAVAASKSVDLAFNGSHRLKENTGRIEDATARFGGAEIHVSGTYEPVASGANGAEDPLLTLKLAGQNLPIDELQPLMAAAAVRLPNGAKLKGGTISMNLAITGQPKSLVITGPIALDNTRLVGFDIGSKIHGIAALSGMKTGDTTEFEKLNVLVRISNAGVLADKIEATIPAVGELTGSGTVSAADQLDFNLLVKVASAKGIGKVGAGIITMVNGSGGSSGKGSGVPLHITGTPDDPYITADVGGIVQKKTKSITSIFGKKK